MSGSLRRWGPTATIGAALVVEVFAAGFFVLDSLMELATDTSKSHALMELPVAIALCVGTWFTVLELRRLLRRSGQQDRALALVRGAFLQVVERKFDLWRLTPSEREVAWLSLKGVELAGIAELRGSAAGTVRAQLARVYGKSGVTSRAQFASLFMDQLMERWPDLTQGKDDN